MGVRNASVFTNTVIGSPPLAAETIIATTGPLGLFADNAQVLLFAFIEMTIGTAGTNLTLRLRRGPLVTSPLVNVGTNTSVAATNSTRFAIVYADFPGVAAGLQYTLTAQVANASATSAVNDVGLTAMVL